MQTFKSISLASLCIVSFTVASSALADHWPTCPNLDQLDSSPQYVMHMTADYYGVGINNITKDGNLWGGGFGLEAKSSEDAMHKIADGVKIDNNSVESLGLDKNNNINYICDYNVNVKGVDHAFLELITPWEEDTAKAQFRTALAKHIAG